MRITTDPNVPLNRSQSEYVFIEPPALRDLFAAFALAGLLANYGYTYDRPDDAEKRAALAYRFADAMIEQRAQSKE